MLSIPPSETARLTRRSFALGGSGLAVASALPTVGARAASAETRILVDRARATLEDAQHDPQFGAAPDLLGRARAIMVVPQLVKAGFFVGGSGGNGVLLVRTADGKWGNPLFYAIGSASFGLQIGAEVADPRQSATRRSGRPYDRRHRIQCHRRQHHQCRCRPDLLGTFQRRIRRHHAGGSSDPVSTELEYGVLRALCQSAPRVGHRLTRRASGIRRALLLNRGLPSRRSLRRADDRQEHEMRKMSTI